MLSVNISNADLNEFEAQSRALEKFHNRDYSPALDELKRMFPSSWDRMPLRSCPFVYSVARELGGGLYSVDPSRTFEGIQSEEIERSIKALYERSGVTDALRQAHEMLCIQGSCAILLLPDTSGTLTLYTLAPWRIRPERSSPMVTDERSIKKWRVRMPRRETVYGSIEEDDLIITPETITWSDGKPLLETAANPIGPAIPIVTLRASPAPLTGFWPAVNSDLLACQLALCISYTDLLAITSAQGWGQRVISGAGIDAEEIQVGPDTVLSLDEGTYSCVSGDSGAAQYIQSVEAYLKICLSQNKVDPSALLSSGAYTAASRIIERSDRVQERLVFQKSLERAEARIYRHLARWTNASRGAPVFPVQGIKVRLEYHEFKAPFDPLHESQASQIRAESGLESIVEQIAKERGISKAEAEDVLETNLEIQRKIKGSQSFGLQISRIRSDSGVESPIEVIAKERGISYEEAATVFDRNLEVQRRVLSASGVEAKPIEAEPAPDAEAV